MIDFELTPEQKKLQEQARKFAQEEIAPHAAEFDRTGEFPMDICRKAWEQKLINNAIPREYGGYGTEPDILKSRIIAEEFARAQVRPGLGGQGIAYLVPMLLDLGSEEQKKRFILPTIHGEMVWCEGYSEPNAGSDLASLKRGLTTIRPSVFHGPTGTKSVSGEGTGQAGRVVIGVTGVIPQASSRLHLRSCAAERIPRRMESRKLWGTARPYLCQPASTPIVGLLCSASCMLNAPRPMR